MLTNPAHEDTMEGHHASGRVFENNIVSAHQLFLFLSRAFHQHPSAQQQQQQQQQQLLRVETTTPEEKTDNGR